MSTQPEALRLADWLDAEACGGSNWNAKMNAAAAELRRLQADNEAFGIHLSERMVDLAKAEAQRDALLEAIKPMIDLAEFWSNHHQNQKRHMSEQDFKVWLALGHESNAMLNARAAIKAVEEGK